MTTLYTLGYTGLTPDQILEFVKSLGDGAKIADIRDSPWSKHERWDFTTLTTHWGDRYVHVPSLGNVARRDGGISLRNREEGVIEIEELLLRGPVVLMCACEDFRECHRLPAANAVKSCNPLLRVVHMSTRDVLDKILGQRKLF